MQLDRLRQFDICQNGNLKRMSELIDPRQHGPDDAGFGEIVRLIGASRSLLPRLLWLCLSVCGVQMHMSRIASCHGDKAGRDYY